MKAIIHGGKAYGTKGQVERMNRTLKEVTVNNFCYDFHDELKRHLHAYLMAYNFAKRLKAINGITSPWQFIYKSMDNSS